MKKLFLISALLCSTPIWAKCNTGVIGVYHQTGFGISIGSGGSKMGFYDKDTTNVPLSINNELACYKRTSKFSVKSESKKNEQETNKIIITPLKVEYENIPSPHHREYVFVEQNANPLLRKFHTISFICTGEIPLSVEGKSDHVLKIIAESNKAEVSISHVFATGAAADNIHKNNAKKLVMQESFDFFKNLYNTKTLKEVVTNQECCQDIRVPSILSHTSISALTDVERKIASEFTTLGSEVPNGCSTDFIKTMQPYLLENYEQNESLKDYKIQKKWFSNDLVLEF